MEKEHISAKALAMAKKAIFPLVFPTHDSDFDLSDQEYDGAVMDKIMSTRMDEAVIRHVDMLAKKLSLSKKAVLENAIQCYAEKIESEEGLDVLAVTFGSWKRDQSAEDTIQTIKDTMRKSQERYKR